ncbi:MAG: von Willebrand factor type, partial [Dehalococcoidales bacterium]|nr:von Willebrand factor type [Dehalococcoidales bacterium]
MKGRLKGSKFVAAVLSLMMLTVGFGGTPVQAASYPFSDNVEVPTANNWVADPPWAKMTTDAHSANTSWTDSPGGYYANNANVALTLATPVALPSGGKPQLKFWHHYQLEAGFDFAYVELSTDGGANWPNRLATYSGTITAPYRLGQTSVKSVETPQSTSPEPWVFEQLDLTSYAGQSNVKIRYRLVSDNSVARDGWCLDDIGIAELPPAVTMNATSNPTQTSLSLSWSQSTAPDFA